MINNLYLKISASETIINYLKALTSNINFVKKVLSKQLDEENIKNKWKLEKSIVFLGIKSEKLK